jgi:uncharacterized DUF497 family protein
MGELLFSWDSRKARSNEIKHGVSFEEAQTVFLDDSALLIDDPDHSWDEKRFLLLGLSSSMRLVVDSHALRDDGDTVRIINAREVAKWERPRYMEQFER